MTQDFLQKMQQRYEELTGIPADEASDIGIRLRILAEQLELLYQQLEEEKKQAFAQTATGLALEQHAQQKGLQRRKAVAAQGEVTFSRTAAADEPIVIPQGGQHPVCDCAAGDFAGRADAGQKRRPLPNRRQKRQCGSGQSDGHGDAGAGDCCGLQ